MATFLATQLTEAENKEKAKVARAVALMEQVEQLSEASKRQRIPDEVKTTVWQRDKGQCVNCPLWMLSGAHPDDHESTVAAETGRTCGFGRGRPAPGAASLMSSRRVVRVQPLAGRRRSSLRLKWIESR